MSKFVKVATTDEMANQLAKHLAMDGEKIALFKVGGAFYALSDTHLPLAWCEVRPEDRGRPGTAGADGC